MKNSKKFSVVLVLLVIIGSIFANITVIASITPKSIQSSANEIENQTIIDNSFDFDLTMMTEISEYILTQAEHYNFDVRMIIYSSGLLFESDDTLIIFGHGHLNSENQYFIGDYSENSIREMAKDKETVALLSCFSSNIKLTNDRQLIYETQIDLVSAMTDLSTILQWEKAASFLPSINIQLFDLDPGPGGNGWSLSNPPPAFNLMRQAYTYDGTHKYWNLLTDSGINSLSAYMMSHKYRKIELTFKGELLTQTSSQTGYTVNTYTLEFDSKIITQSDMKDYLNIENIYIDGVLEKRKTYTIKIDIILETLISDAGIANRLAALAILCGTFVPIGLFLVGLAAGKLISIALSGTLGALASVICAILGSVAIWLGVALLVIAIVVVIVAIVITFGG